MDEPSQWDRLAEHVRRRRQDLGLSVRAAAARAGIDRGTWGTTENAERQLSQHLWLGVEQALSWAPGSVQAVLDGGDPGVETVNGPQLDESTVAAEVERVSALPLSAAARMRMIKALIDVYEDSTGERDRR